MGRTEVDEERLDDVVSEASVRCNILYTLAFHDYCDLDTDCNKCPFNDVNQLKNGLERKINLS